MQAVLSKLAQIDGLAITRVQAMYDYVLDRYGILVGTFRCCAVSACFLFVFLKGYFGVPSDGARLAFIFMWAVVFVPLIGILLVKPHLERDNALHESQRLIPLNASAIMQQEVSGFLVRLLTVVLALLIYSWRDGLEIHDVISIGLLMIWLWSKAVMVRPRDTSRAKQFSPRAVST